MTRHQRPHGPPDRQHLLSRPRLRLDWHRSTTSHFASVYPFQSDEGFGHRGPYMGTNVTGGFQAFHFDPFELYAAGLLSGPNCLVIGEVGTGKSATVKAFISRSLTVYGRRRFIAVLDPKGEYGPFAQAHGLSLIRLRPGGTDRLNPMARRPGTPSDDLVGRQGLAAALVTGVLDRSLDPVEDAVLGTAVAALVQRGQPFTLRDLVAVVARPDRTSPTFAQLDIDELTRAATPVVFALDKLVNRTLAGMFDDETTISADWADRPGIVIDLSSVYYDRQALPLVMLAATSWLSAVLNRSGDRRAIQVVDEAWAAVAHGARHFQASLKLSRAYGVSTWLICHRPSDLTAQADDGTSDAKIAAGLLSDIQTRIVMRQSSDQVDVAQQLLGLTEREAQVVGQLVTGRALWRIRNRSAVVHTILTARDRRLFGTDAAMAT